MRNIEGRNLVLRDEGLLILMRRENPDAFWGTEPSTVGGDLVSLIIIRIDILEGRLVSHPMSQLSPFPLGDLVRMKPSFIVLHLSLKPVRYKDYM